MLILTNVLQASATKISLCINSLGGYECNCQEGYFGDGKTCFPGFCSDSNCPSSDHKECVSPRSNECKCLEGYNLNNSSNCVDVDECVKLPCDQKAKCSNNPGSYSCTCKTGSFGNGFNCSCKTGFTNNVYSCPDINECASGLHNCHTYATCNNFEGFFNCSCNAGYLGNGTSCSKTTVLVLNTRKGVKAPLLVDAKGRSDTNFTMSFGRETEVYHSCSVTYRNRFYIFGGNERRRQISEVTHCELKRIGTLGFDHYAGDRTLTDLVTLRQSRDWIAKLINGQKSSVIRSSKN